MAPTVVALVTLACTFGGAMLGLRLRQSLPSDYVSGDSRDSIKVIMGLVATMTALILGLVTASAKSSYDAIDSAVKQASISLLALDRELRSFGPETSEIRTGLKRWTEIRVDAIWPEKTAKPTAEDDAATAETSEGLAEAVRRLTPANNAQRAHKARAVELSQRLIEMRWLVIASPAATVPTAFLVILIFWLTATEFGFGLCSPPNPATVAALLVCAISVAAALFLVMELGSPFAGGVVSVSPAPLQRALELMNQ